MLIFFISYFYDRWFVSRTASEFSCHLSWIWICHNLEAFMTNNHPISSWIIKQFSDNLWPTMDDQQCHPTILIWPPIIQYCFCCYLSSRTMLGPSLITLGFVEVGQFILDNAASDKRREAKLRIPQIRGSLASENGHSHSHEAMHDVKSCGTEFIWGFLKS